MVGKFFYGIYRLLRWTILAVLLLCILLLFLIERPSVTLSLTQGVLAEQNITYGTMEGGLLSGFKLTDVNYNNQVKASEVKLKIDINALEKRILHINDLNLQGIEIDKAFLQSLIENNSSEENTSQEKSTLPFDQVIVDRANIGLKNIAYQEYQLKEAQLSVKNLNTNLSDQYRGEVTLNAQSNVGNIDLNSDINNKQVNLDATIRGDKTFINPLLQEHNVSLPTDPKLTIHAQGETDGRINYHITANQLDLDYTNNYQLKSERLKLSGDYHIPQKDLNAKLDTELGGNIAQLNLMAISKFNLNDLNDTLSFDINGQMQPQTAFAKAKLGEHNITLTHTPTLDIKANGTLKKANFATTLRELKIKQESMDIELPILTLNGQTQALKGDTDVTLGTTLNTSAGEGVLSATSSFNFNDLEKTLTFDLHTKALGELDFINKQLKREPFTLTDSPKVNLNAHGDLNQITAQVEAKTVLKKGTVLSPLTLESSPILLNLKTNHIDGEIKLNSSAPTLAIDLNSRFKGDYTQPKLLQTDTKAVIKHFNAFGINLEPIVPLNISANSHTNGATATIDSERIQLLAKTKDYDHVNIKLNTGNLYLYKMVELPPELDHKFIKLNLRGDATLSKQYFNLTGKLESNKKFQAEIEAHNSDKGLNAQLGTKYLKAAIQGDIEKKNLDAKIGTTSLKALQKELHALYPFKIFEVDGQLQTRAKLRGEALRFNLSSPKLKFEGFNVEKIAINADYTPKLLTIDKLNFTTTGFKQKQLNQAFYLNQKAYAHLGNKRDILVDMHPNIMVKATGDATNLTGTAKINKLPLGHPEYGSGLLYTDITFKQKGVKRNISGDITLKKLKLFYEAKFLEADYDPDVIILTKKDKEKKGLQEDNFLMHTAIDLTIKAPNVEYKTPDIELDFDINLKAQKSFGKEVALLGKIEEIEGYVDQVPKRFIVKESNIVFKGGKKINPLLDIHVEYELPQVLIGINIGGNAQRPKLDFSSEPVMPKKDILSYLLFGVSTASLAEGEGSLSREAELFIINQAARDFAHEFDLDRIFIKDDGTGEGYAIEAGKNISKSNMIIIESSKVGNSFILEREFNKNIKLQVGQHQKEQPSQSIDLFFKKKFK